MVNHKKTAKDFPVGTVVLVAEDVPTHFLYSDLAEAVRGHVGIVIGRCCSRYSLPISGTSDEDYVVVDFVNSPNKYVVEAYMSDVVSKKNLSIEPFPITSVAVEPMWLEVYLGKLSFEILEESSHGKTN